MKHFEQGGPEVVLQKTTYTLAGIGAIFGLTLQEFATYASLLLGGLTYLTSAFFQWRRDRREELALKHRIATQTTETLCNEHAKDT